jgi:hypothetical protein
MAEPKRNAWGAIILDDRAAPGEQADLGRSVDMGFGEITRDPVGAAQRIPELIQEGEVGGLEIPGDRVPMSPFPLEPGESRAAKELPEMFGTFQFGPEEEERPPGAKFDIPPDPLSPLSLIPTIKGSGVGATLSKKDALQIAAAGMSMFDPSEIAQMLMQNDPETGKRKWPEFSMSQAPDGTFIIHNTKNNTQAVINRPGMSTMDAMQAMGITAAFTPAAKLMTGMASLAGRIAVGASASGVTEDILQRWQEAAGGEYNPADVAIATGLGPIAEVGRPAIGLVQRTGRFIGSYLPENMFGGIKAVLPEAKAAVLSYAKKAAEFLQTRRPAIVMTQDAVPEIHTPKMQIILKMVERLPITGTGRLRKKQQVQRVEVLRNLADRYDLNPTTDYGATILRELNAGKGPTLEGIQNTVRESVGEMADNTVNIINFRKTMTRIVNDEKQYGELANTGVLDLLQRAQRAVWQGGQKQDFGRGFGVLDDWVAKLRLEAGSAPPAAKALINDAADALESDLKRTAQEKGGKAGQRWLSGITEEKRLVEQMKSKALKDLIETGRVDQKIIRMVAQRGNPAEMKLLYDNMGPEGINAARQQILKNAMRYGGWRRVPAGEANVNAQKVLNFMEKDNIEAQLNTFFPDEAAQRELGGIMEYLRMTADAEKVGQGVGMAAAGGFGQTVADGVNLALGGLIGFMGHGYQSAPVRNLFLRLYHVKGDVAAKDAIMSELTPILMMAGREWVQTDSDPQDLILASDEFIESYTDRQGEPTTERLNPVIGQRAPGEAEPGLIEQLRLAVGLEPGESAVGAIGEAMGFPQEEEEQP